MSADERPADASPPASETAPVQTSPAAVDEELELLALVLLAIAP